MISETQSYANTYSDYAALGVATGVLTFVTLPVMYVRYLFPSTSILTISKDCARLLREHLHVLDCS